MRDLTSELTVFVIAIEKSLNYDQCLQALENQTVKFQLKQILNVQPMNEAFNQMIYQCDTPYFIQIDEDFILYKNAIELMYDNMKNLDASKYASAHFKLRDVFLNTIIGSAVIYNYNIIKDFHWKNVMACDNEQRIRLKEANYLYQIYSSVIGLHHPNWTIKSIFKRFCNKGAKEEQLNIDKNCLQVLLKKIKENCNELNLFAFLGYITGILVDKDRTEERNYFDYVSTEFLKLYNIFQNLGQINTYVEFISPTKNAILQSLSDYLTIEFETDIEKIKNSKKSLLIWNPISYIRNNKHQWKKELCDYFINNNKNIYTVERGALPNTIFIDKYGFLTDSQSYNKFYWDIILNDQQKNKIIKYINKFIHNYNTLEPQSTIRLSKENFYKKYNLKNEDKIIFIPLQVVDDTVTLLWCDWVKSIENFYNIINYLAEDCSNIKFLVKNHPIQLARDNKYFTSNQLNIINVDDSHYKDCVAYSDAVITVNSSVGLQAMMWQKPTLILGKSFYQFNEINQKINDYEELKNAIQNEDYIQPNLEKIYRFLYYLKYNYYSNCQLIKTGINSTKIEKVERIVYEHPSTLEKIIINSNIIESLLEKLIINNIDFWLLEESCYQIVLKHNFNLENLIVGVKDLETKNNIELLDNRIIVNIDPNQKTKWINIKDFQLQIPFPIIKYLENFKHMDWDILRREK